MILSRSIAKRRLAAGVRPGWFAAWSLVLLDGLIVVGLLALLSPPIGMAATDAGITSLPAIIALFFVVYFIPFQAVLILSTIWAVRSRWQDDAGNPKAPERVDR